MSSVNFGYVYLETGFMVFLQTVTWILFKVTTDLHDRCIDNHTGTSASAPLAAGMCALALEAKYVIGVILRLYTLYFLCVDDSAYMAYYLWSKNVIQL